MLPKRLSRKKIFSSDRIDLSLDTVQFDSGNIIEDYHFLQFKNDSVVIVVLNKLNEICFISSPRYVTQKLELELPAGSIEEGETVIEAGKREFLEETGYKVGRLKLIYTFNPANSISNQKAYVLIGKVNSSTPIQEFNRVEVSSVEWFSKDKIKKLILSNSIMDGFSMIAILLYTYIENV